MTIKDENSNDQNTAKNTEEYQIEEEIPKELLNDPSVKVIELRYSQNNRPQTIAMELYKKIQNMVMINKKDKNAPLKQPYVPVKSAVDGKNYDYPKYVLISHPGPKLEYPNFGRDACHCCFGPGVCSFYATDKPDSMMGPLCHGKVTPAQSMDPDFVPRDVNKFVTLYRISNTGNVFQKVDPVRSIWKSTEIRVSPQKVSLDKKTNCIVFHPNIKDPLIALEEVEVILCSMNSELDFDSPYRDLISNITANVRDTYELQANYIEMEEQVVDCWKVICQISDSENIPVYWNNDNTMESLNLVKVGLERLPSNVNASTEKIDTIKAMIAKIESLGNYSQIRNKKLAIIESLERAESEIRDFIQCTRGKDQKSECLRYKIPNAISKISSSLLYIKYGYRNEFDHDIMPRFEPEFVFIFRPYLGTVLLSDDPYHVIKGFNHPGEENFAETIR